MRKYSYVGPTSIRDKALAAPPGVRIDSQADLAKWLVGHADQSEHNGDITATFVIDNDGVLRLAHRRSEHVACASGDTVMSAGEITFSVNGEVIEVTNQSIGYCPEPDSWPMVATALDRIQTRHPGMFTMSVVFRRCSHCNQTNIVKDAMFTCELCESDLSKCWNFSAAE